MPKTLMEQLVLGGCIEPVDQGFVVQASGVVILYGVGWRVLVP